MDLMIEDSITEKDFLIMENDESSELVLNLASVQLINSKDLSRLLMLHTRKKKKIFLKNANDYIKETILTLKLEGILNI